MFCGISKVHGCTKTGMHTRARVHTRTHAHRTRPIIHQYHYSEALSSKLEHVLLASFQTSTIILISQPTAELICSKSRAWRKCGSWRCLSYTWSPPHAGQRLQPCVALLTISNELGLLSTSPGTKRRAGIKVGRGGKKSSVLASNSSAVRGILMRFLLGEAVSAAVCSKAQPTSQRCQIFLPFKCTSQQIVKVWSCQCDAWFKTLRTFTSMQFS